MKKLFTMIRQGNIEEVRHILDKKPELISCTAKAPPRKDDGQSPLMVAIKSDNVEIAHLLLDFGADVNFVNGHEPLEPYEIFAPIWDTSLGQCFLRIKYFSERAKLRTEQHFELLCRLLNVGMDINREITYSRPFPPAKKAWRVALDHYVHLSYKSYSDYSATMNMEQEEQQQLQELTARILEVLAVHGAYIYDFHMGSEPNCNHDIDYVIRNLIFNRNIGENIKGKLTEWEQKYCPQWFELRWDSMDAILRPYYAKDNPYYGSEVSEERKAFFERLKQAEEE